MPNTLWFHSHFSALCVIKTDNDWQRFVTQIMHAKHGGVFIQVDPSFSGDQGCDGYVGGLMLACYGASRPSEAYVATKVSDDFRKAKLYWREVMTKWAFVHNNANGLPRMAAQAVASLQKAESSSGVRIEVWPPQVLWQECLANLSESLLIPIIGAPPSIRPAGMSYIAEAMRALSRTPRIAKPGPTLPVPAEKIEFNKFSPATEELIKQYQVHTYLVRHYFESGSPGEQAQVSLNIKMRYDALVARLGDADAVFHGLCDELVEEAFTKDQAANIAEQKSAALLIITHFFESCLIFETPNEVH